MKKIFFILLLLLSVINVNAQKSQDVLYLNNGSVIKGTVIEAIPNGNVKIQTIDGSIYVYKMEEVSKISKDNSQVENKKNEYKGYVGFVEAAYGFDRLYIMTTHGYQFNPHFFAGIGTGFDFNYGLIPVYIDARTKLHMESTPFFEIKLGMCTDNENEGVYIAPTIGYRFELSKKSALNFGLSFDYAEINEGSICINASYEF